MAPRQYVDISHFRAPYKNWPYLGMGGIGAMDPSMPIDATAPIVPDSSAVTSVVGQANSALVTVDADGVKTLKTEIALTLFKILVGRSYMIFSADPPAILVTSLVATAGTTTALSWLNDMVTKGRSIIVSTSDPGGLAAALGGSAGGQLALTAVSTRAEEITTAGPKAPISSALVAPSKFKSGQSGGLQKASIGPTGVALIALAVVGGGVLLITNRKKHAVSNRRRRARR